MNISFQHIVLMMLAYYNGPNISPITENTELPGKYILLKEKSFRLRWTHLIGSLILPLALDRPLNIVNNSAALLSQSSCVILAVSFLAQHPFSRLCNVFCAIV